MTVQRLVAPSFGHVAITDAIQTTSSASIVTVPLVSSHAGIPFENNDKHYSFYFMCVANCCFFLIYV